MALRVSNSAPREIRLTPEFQRRLKKLAKKYPQVRSDLEPILKRLSSGEMLGDQIAGIGFSVFKVRIKNSDNQKGKSGGYRLIYWLRLKEVAVLLDIYSKSGRSDIEVSDIYQIINRFSEESDKD